ncbi:20S proteasome, regulatory subunit alpha type PSMA3/PRE10 [Pseudoloma neurophilia]|uniref:20S proteasome, regulatory subunit alpha type PSMA3/PRE10 n=1 Tax=Pseudoloma neurophilia TaxID=146866 RepID=A0A0R0LV45_9MICR|nr:20S proteasome, regulatory subunit alpha type PSMA3/PRE10 [Pseudoloma neurophilia]
MSLIDFGPIYTNTGAILQIDYATKCAESGSTVIGINTKYGLIVCVEKPIDSVLYKIKEEKRIKKFRSNVLLVGSGLLHDLEPIETQANQRLGLAEKYRQFISANEIKNAISASVHDFTIYYGVRPVGCHLMFGHSEKIKKMDGESACKIKNQTNQNEIKTRLYVTDCSSLTKEVHAYAIGKGASRAKTELEKLNADFENMKPLDAIDHSIRIMYRCFDPLKDKPFFLEVALMTDKIQEVDDDVVTEISEKYKDLNMDDE